MRRRLAVRDQRLLLFARRERVDRGGERFHCDLDGVGCSVRLGRKG